MSTIFTLSISPTYVNHWGLWEAVREIIQNAYDEKIRSPDCVIEINHTDKITTITSSTGILTPETLLLGNSSKSSSPEMRGKFGEGYKLALLVLSRLNYRVELITGTDLWIPTIEFDKAFNTDVLKIKVISNSFSKDQGVQFKIFRISEEDWKKIQDNLIKYEDEDQILFEHELIGRVYVGGLYVTTDKTFKYGYSFKPSTIKLDRDRGMISGFDLAYQTSKLWTLEKYAKYDTVDKLIKEEAPDVKYVEYHTYGGYSGSGYSFSQTYYDRYVEKHGADVIPVTTQEEIEEVTAAGAKWVLVPKMVKNLLSKVKTFFIPSSLPPVKRLEKFLLKHEYSLNDEAKAELKDIIRIMSPATELQEV